MSSHDSYYDHDGYLPPEIPILEDVVAGKPVTAPCCGKTVEWTEKPNAGWRCEDCYWEQEAQPEDYEQFTDEN